jgi:hypothetical protein
MSKIIDFSNGARVIIEHGRYNYIPSERARKEIERRKQLMVLKNTSEDRIRNHHRLRQLFRFGNCEAGGSLVTNIFLRSAEGADNNVREHYNIPSPRVPAMYV